MDSWQHAVCSATREGSKFSSGWSTTRGLEGPPPGPDHAGTAVLLGSVPRSSAAAVTLSRRRDLLLHWHARHCFLLAATPPRPALPLRALPSPSRPLHPSLCLGARDKEATDNESTKYTQARRAAKDRDEDANQLIDSGCQDAP